MGESKRSLSVCYDIIINVFEIVLVETFQKVQSLSIQLDVLRSIGHPQNIQESRFQEWNILRTLEAFKYSDLILFILFNSQLKFFSI